MPINVKSQLNQKVFVSASSIIIALIIYTAALPEQAQSLFSFIQAGIVDNGSWFYVLTVAFIFFFVIFLGLSRYGDIRLGPDHATPDYSMLTWLSMLFAAGMGIGLMFFGVAEPLMHYLSPPTAETVSVFPEPVAVRFISVVPSMETVVPSIATPVVALISTLAAEVMSTSPEFEEVT